MSFRRKSISKIRKKEGNRFFKVRSMYVYLLL